METKTIDLTKISRIRESYMFKFTTPEILTEDEAVQAQLSLGYHPAGYGFYAYKKTEEGTTWKCGDNCD